MNPQIDIKAIVQEFGPPGYENDKGKLTRLNESFWASLYAQQREKIIYDHAKESFTISTVRTSSQNPRTPFGRN